MIEAYGCTETCGPISMAIAGDLNGSHVGSPWPCLEVKLCDVPDMNLVAARDNKGEVSSHEHGYITRNYLVEYSFDRESHLHEATTTVPPRIG